MGFKLVHIERKTFAIPPHLGTKSIVPSLPYGRSYDYIDNVEVVGYLLEIGHILLDEFFRLWYDELYWDSILEANGIKEWDDDLDIHLGDGRILLDEF